ncbi:MAG: hypothetical protein GY779_16190, partial [Gammaproteobacteria bacterium]|nr:hypothetical protein [Gammaproteobacteria bacterium]
DYLNSNQLKQSGQRFSNLFDQLPVGAREANYQTLKKAIDKLQSEAVVNIEEHLLSHPNDLKDMVAGISITAVNQTLLDMHKAPTVEKYLIDEYAIDKWWNAGWVEFYARQIAAFASGKNGVEAEYSGSGPGGSCLQTLAIATIVKGHEEDWSRVITIHEDISRRNKSEQALMEAKTVA